VFVKTKIPAEGSGGLTCIKIKKNNWKAEGKAGPPLKKKGQQPTSKKKNLSDLGEEARLGI